jgi:hypothetical protein
VASGAGILPPLHRGTGMSIPVVVNVVATPDSAETLSAWLTFGASAVSALAWPAAVVWLAFLLRKQVPGVLGALKTFKGWGIEAEFERDVRNLVAVAEVTDTTTQRVRRRDRSSDTEDAAAATNGEKSETRRAKQAEGAWQVPGQVDAGKHAASVERTATLQRRKLALRNATKIAITDQKGAVLMAWHEVESALLELSQVDDTPPGINPRKLLDHIEEQRLLPPPLLILCKGLLNSRNKIQHDPNFTPSLDAVYAYIGLAENVLAGLYTQRG